MMIYIIVADVWTLSPQEPNLTLKIKLWFKGMILRLCIVFRPDESVMVRLGANLRITNSYKKNEFEFEPNFSSCPREVWTR